MAKKSTKNIKVAVTREEALDFHRNGKPGKISIAPHKPLMTQRDLSLAYSPGVAWPCLEIQKDPETSYEYTSRGNTVAIISNGTAVLGLGNLGALASKPVMEGKATLFKRFADIDGIDLEVDTEDADTFINVVRYLGPSWGGINLEDIKAPECFIIEQKLKELMDIPVFHDDQHGTAIISLAGMINAADITGRRFQDMKIVVNGAGAAGIACLELLKAMGIPDDNAILCDTKGVIYKGRKDGMNQWKSAHAADTKARTLAEALKGADVFLGLSVKGAVTQEMVKSMAKSPVIFAMANPDPEITPDEVHEVRSDAIVATGRSDYANQVNNVMGFPFIFRGALDVQATTINEEMKIAAAKALAQLAREHVADEVAAAYSGRKMKYGPEYIIPTPFDPRLIATVSPAVAQAAMDSGVARKPIKNMAEYKVQLNSRLDPTANKMNLIFERVRENPTTIVFAEGEEEQIIRAAIAWQNNDYGQALIVGRQKLIESQLTKMGIKDLKGVKIVNASNSPHVNDYIDLVYGKLQRKGYLKRDVSRIVKNDRNTFASAMVLAGHAQAMVTGLTRNYYVSLKEVTRLIDPEPNRLIMGYSLVLTKTGKTVFIADTTVHELPTPQQLAQIAIQTAYKAREWGHEPRVAFLSFSNFGNPMAEKATRVREAVEILDKMKVDFEYDGEMSPDVALNPELMKLYPFCRLSGPANVLVMPALHSANIVSKMLQELGGGSVISPILSGFEQAVQIVPLNATVSDILNYAALAAISALKNVKK